ncbi:MAG: MBL fold metallo-hydrolase [Planctomycetes bacterium]|nr:MBL fold metallo-hydrolase [Planctomycetota bacterium]
MGGANMIFRRFTVGSYPINGYLVADPETHIGVFIDPGGFHDEIAEFITQQRVELRHIFFTHGHADHTEGLGEFMERYSLQRYAGKDEVAAANYTLHGGEEIEVGTLRFHTFSTPGHSPHGISYHCRDRVFTGDALFCGSLGGTASQELADLQIAAVRKHIFSLPESTLVFPGHGPMSTVAAEKYGNPFFASVGD